MPDDRFPDLSDLNRLRPAEGAEIRTAGGAPIAFVPAALNGRKAASYERQIFAAGAVPTRCGSWHDLFNALVWLSFPRTKAALNALHVAELGGGDGAGPRGRLRDQATLFDEGGMIVACGEQSLGALLRDFEWRSLFCDERARVAASMRFFILGHALLAKALQPYKAMAARAFTVAVDPSFFSLTVLQQLAGAALLVAIRHAIIRPIPAARAVGLRALFAKRESFTPVPVMGIPGWTDDNRMPGYYDDASVFRPRNSTVPPHPPRSAGSASGLK